MFGAILGDIIGRPFEFISYKSKEFPLFSEKSRYSDDTVMSIAVAEAYYGIPDELRQEGYKRIPQDMTEILLKFENKCGIINEK